jgi:hypothetical protein
MKTIVAYRIRILTTRVRSILTPEATLSPAPKIVELHVWKKTSSSVYAMLEEAMSAAVCGIKVRTEAAKTGRNDIDAPAASDAASTSDLNANLVEA